MLLKIKVLLFYFVLICVVSLNGQNSSITNRTPEQEARKQTEKMQKELDLTPEQTKKVYQLNLKYARERKESNSRVDAIQRIRKKDVELKKILKSTQYRNLISKRTHVNSVEIDGKRRYSNSNYSRFSSTSTKKDHIHYSSPKNSTILKRSSNNSKNSSKNSWARGNRPVRSTKPKASTEVQRRSQTNVFGGSRPVRSSNVKRSSNSSNNSSSNINSRQPSTQSKAKKSSSANTNIKNSRSSSSSRR